MSFRQKNLQCSPQQSLRSHSEMLGLETAQLSEALEETHLSSHPPMPGNSKGAPDAGIPRAPDDAQSFYSSSTAVRATSSSKSYTGSSNQEEEDSALQAGPDPRNVPRNALDKNVALLVNYMLLKYQRREPVTKAAMLKKVTKGYKHHFVEILQRASERLEIVFGLDMKEVDPINHYYGLLIKIGLTYDGMQHGEKGVPKTGILILILGVIFMNGNRATEEKIWEFLNLSGLYPGKKHFIFGEPRELITKVFVKEKYLQYQQVADSDPAEFEFLWGPRAHAETSKMQVLEFLAKIHETDPSSFPSQYEEALQDEEERAHARISARAVSTSVAAASFHTKPSSGSHT
ncbi:PREDICTED: melanoma-associated antigen B16 [Hipposideros armiger]|uniref:Melanoma-associated antigen B16 n=1 Tax=Hipposideros armiger TaxID=186990 RepID=A0A8B7Q539_HIPAR|nr:PREDICTED: melanoma-associated antigen B16 [Hipposideros armiger]